MRGTHTLREILEQPAAWAAALQRFEAEEERVVRLFEARSPDEVVFTGCGSSYYLSLTAASVFQQATGLSARAVPASEILRFPESVFARQAVPLVVAASRSGTTSETLRAVRLAARRGIPALCVTCAARSPLARQADLALVSPQGGEQSVVMTKSLSSMLLLELLVAASTGGVRGLQRELRRLPALGRRVLKIAHPLMRDVGTMASSRFVFLGAGPAHGIAWEAMLKLTEMAQRPSVAYHPLEFRHGPIAVAGPRTVAILFGTQAGARLEKALVRDLRQHGATVVALGDDWSTAGADVEVSLGIGLSDAARTALYLPFGQLLAYHRAVGTGLDPDRPHHLTSVVRL